jgi:hypothetical protein
MARVMLDFGLRARRQRRRALAAGIAFFILLLFTAALAALAHLHALRLTQVEVAGATPDQAPLVKAYVEAGLAGSYVWLFPRDNAFLYPRGGLERGLLAAFPSLESATISRVGLNTLEVSVSARSPAALWCGAAPATSSACFLLDQNGIAYAALSFSGSDFDRYFGALTGSTTPAHYLTPGAFASLAALVGVLKQADTSGLSSVFVDSNQDVTVSFGDGFALLFALSDADITYQRFTLARQAAVFEEHPLSDFQYLDLRFGDKLYYKLKNQ